MTHHDPTMDADRLNSAPDDDGCTHVCAAADVTAHGLLILVCADCEWRLPAWRAERHGLTGAREITGEVTFSPPWLIVEGADGGIVRIVRARAVTP